MNLRQFFADYFSFNRAEQRGIALMLMILAGLILANVFYPEDIVDDQAGFTEFGKEVKAFMADMKSAEESEKRARENYKRVPWTAKDSSFPKSSRPAVAFTIEVNGADTLELQRLKGIGPGFARRIVNYRERLGGFVRKSQLLEVFGMDTSRYNYIKGYITVDASAVRKIDINNVTFKDMMHHPYFTYEITREIVLQRKKMKRFGSVDDLRAVKGISDTVFNKISVYVEIR